jgi:hypothetical protein
LLLLTAFERQLLLLPTSETLCFMERVPAWALRGSS